MKRLVTCFILFLAILILITGVDLNTASAKTSYIKPDTWINQKIKDVNKTTGKQTRIDKSQYGFEWYIYNKNYHRFLMLGVENGIIAAAYSNSKYLRIQGGIQVGTSRENVRKIFGTPLYFFQVGNTYYSIPDTD